MYTVSDAIGLDGEHRLIGCSGKGYNNSLAGESGFVRGKGDDDFYIIDGVRTGRDAVEGLKMVYVQSGQIVKEDYVAYKDVPNFKKGNARPISGGIGQTQQEEKIQ